MRTMSTAVTLHVLRDLREVLGFGCDCSVEFRHWDTSGSNLGTEHGCWVNDGGCANLHSTPGGAVTCDPNCYLLKSSIANGCASCPLPLGSCVIGGWSTHHQAEVTHFHLLLYFGQDVRIQGFSKKHHIGPQQPVAVPDVTPWCRIDKCKHKFFYIFFFKGFKDWTTWHQRNSFSISVVSSDGKKNYITACLTVARSEN